MKRLHVILFALLLVALPTLVIAQSKRPAEQAHSQSLPHTNRLPGVDFAEGVTLLTGTSVSPLFGVTALGAWRYYKTPAVMRAELPWYCTPLALGIGGLILLLGLCKTTVLSAFPLLKKPFDVVGTVTSGGNAILASATALPFITQQMMLSLPNDAVALVSDPSLQLASSLSLGWFDLRYLLIPVVIVWFGLVWMASNALNVLIMLSPFGFVDAILKLFKVLLLALITVATLISPLLGVLLCLVLVYVAWLVAPWSFRLTLFGLLVGLDVLMPGRGRRKARVEQPEGFLARQIEGVPVRTYGQVKRATNGQLVFSFRPWLLLRKRELVIPEDRFSVSKGLLFPSLSRAEGEQGKTRDLISFLPRFRSHEQAIATSLGATGVREHAVVRGYVAARAWFGEMVNLRQTKRLKNAEANL